MRRFWIICIMLLSVGLCYADKVLVLHTGEKISGQIIFKNDDVVVIKNAEGARFQYPMTEVSGIEEAVEEKVVEEENKPRKVALNVQIAGGALIVPKNATGGYVNPMLNIGACNLLDKHIFLGLGFGYFGVFAGKDNVPFLPLVLRAEAPLMQTKHAPFLGASVGYGFQPKKYGNGGLHAGIDFGWRYQAKEHTVLMLSYNLSLQQGRWNSTESVVDGQLITKLDEQAAQEQVYHTNRIQSLIATGLKLTIYL